MRISRLKEPGTIREKRFGGIRVMEAAFDSVSITFDGEDAGLDWGPTQSL